MAILTKYSKTLDTQSDKYTSQKQYMNSLNTANPAALPDDYRTPFTYQQWVQRNAGIIPGREYDQYNQYLKDWHKNTYTVADTVEQVKEDYYELLSELSVAFSTPEEAAWFKELDITNNLDLEEAIPMFTKKLKEIAIYFINKRDAIKKAKLKYNMAGSENALRRLFYEYLLKAFTQRDYVLNVPEQSAYDTFPQLSAVRDGFQIFIEELYDDTSYFDKDPTIPVSSYYDLTDQDVIDYYTNLSFDLSALPWLFSTGISKVYANNPLLWTISSELESHGVTSVEDLPLSAYSKFDRVLLNKYVNFLETQKYLGEHQYIISGGYYELDTRTLRHNFVSGNNWFYWPSGEYFRENPNDILFDPIMLSATTLINDGAIAALSHEDADKVFTQVGQSISGAWLRYTEKYAQPETMIATLFTDDITKFKFPFPGYGLSGEGAEWIGPQLVNSISMDRYPIDVLDLYWATTPTSAILGISIHESTLVDDGAYAAQEYHQADQITVRDTPNIDKIHDLNPNEIYVEKFDRAWLYKMLNTDLPISVGKTYINWPIFTYKNAEDTMPMLIPSSQCVPIKLSAINVEETMIGARAGYGLFDSDIIYKLDSPGGYPIECAWLSGVNLNMLATPGTTLMYNATGKIQPSFTLRCKPGNYERFVWYDDEIDINNTTIKHHDHQIDCPYYLATHKSIYNTRGKTLESLGTNGIGGWNDCNCRAIKYSPFGHPGEKYSDYAFMADIIFVDTQFPNEFDIDTWRGTDLSAYNASKDFAFFQLTGNSLEVDVGWGSGRWKTGAGSPFILKPGVVYKYLRANLLRNPGDLIVDAVPDIIIKQKHVNTPSCMWMKAVLNTEGNWEKTVNVSPMVLTPNDYLMYDHIDSNWFCLSSEGTVGSTTQTPIPSAINRNSEWATYDFVTTGIDVSYIWPSKIYRGGPTHVNAELSAVSWKISSPSGTNTTTVKIDPGIEFTFTSEEIGIYSVSATGYGVFGTETVHILPDLICVEEALSVGTSGSLGIETTYKDTLNMAINIPLSGWNYTNNFYNGISYGARPFWAKAYDTGTQTKNKATIAWGGGIRTPIDDYTYITQPDIATLMLSSNNYIEYTRRGSSSLTWTQPINFIINEGQKQWCKLIIDPSKTSPLNDYLLNISNEMIVSATTVESDIVFRNEEDMFVNYWRVGESFIWNQTIINSTNGLPPTGGKWVPYISGSLVEPVVPYANLTNRHFPTIATAPYIGELYSSKDSGGYFIPKLFGANVYMGKGYTNIIDTSLISNDVSARGITASFRDPEKYSGRDRGLSKNNQISPIAIESTDQRWTKASITEGYKAGDVIGSKEYQEYIPYNTKYETLGHNFNGIRTQEDQYDPWTGTRDTVWSDPTYFPPNFRDEYPVESWYEQILPENTFIYQWKTDIFGNQYALFKDDSLTNIYDRKLAYGDMWMRGLDWIISPISAAFPTYDLYQNSMSSVSYRIIDFDVWYDTLMLKTSSHVILEHLNFDYDNNILYTIADQINVIQLDTANGSKYGGHWLFDEEKRVTLCHIVSDSSINIVYPVLYNYDLNVYKKTLLFNFSGNSMLNEISSLVLNSIEEPVFSYNINTKTYNVSFIGHSANYNGIIITTMNINEVNGLESVYSITPIA